MVGLTPGIEAIGRQLAIARRDKGLAESIDLRSIESMEAALSVQTEAVVAFNDEPIGWTLAGTSDATCRLLRCDAPIVGPIFSETTLRSGEHLPVSHTMLGVGAQFAFLFGRSFPQTESETLDFRTIADTILSCHISLQVVGRRVASAVPLNAWTATADFGLSEIYVEGAEIHNWQDKVATVPAILRIDGHVNATGSGADLMGHPLAPALWLCKHLRSRGGCIEAGDIVATGSCTGLVQISPGHVVTGDFGDLGSVELHLD
ncbi:MAG: hypothetical protein JO141_16230 [Bradyrhizobium sp.]|nr:hypothetical protein [Bradyrhizobium sp.]